MHETPQHLAPQAQAGQETALYVAEQCRLMPQPSQATLGRDASRS